MNAQILSTVGLIVGIFLTALEGTVVATAMPAVIADLGGQKLYALPFSVYMLALTISSPLWGRLSDLTGRKRLYLAGVVVFLLGSGLSGAAHHMPWLIVMRAVQGLGAGCVLPLTFTIIGEMYELHERARVQGHISAVWGLSGLLGPLVGGLIVDHASWRWVFYLNLPFGIVALIVCGMFLEGRRDETKPFNLDAPGTLLVTLGTGLLVWGLDQKATWMAVVGLIATALAMPFEFRHPAPLLPIASLRHALSRNCLLNNLLAGAAYFGAIAYVPLFVQQAAGADATTAGIVLTPMIVGWTVASIVGGRNLHRVSLGTLNFAGFFLLTAGFAGFAALIRTGIYVLAATGFIAGCGMGFGMLATLLLVQDNSPSGELGAATAATIFARTIGGALGVSLMSLMIGEMRDITREHLVAGLQRGFFLSFLLTLLACGVSALKPTPISSATSSPSEA